MLRRFIIVKLLPVMPVMLLMLRLHRAMVFVITITLAKYTIIGQQRVGAVIQRYQLAIILQLGRPALV